MALTIEAGAAQAVGGYCKSQKFILYLIVKWLFLMSLDGEKKICLKFPKAKNSRLYRNGPVKCFHLQPKE